MSDNDEKKNKKDEKDKSEDNWVLERILDMMKQREWTIYRLAKESGISYSSLNNLVIRNNMPTIATLMKLCEGLGVSMSEFFAEEIPPCEETSALRTDEKQLLKKYNSLNKSDKALLHAYITGLAKLTE